MEVVVSVYSDFFSPVRKYPSRSGMKSRVSAASSAASSSLLRR